MLALYGERADLRDGRRSLNLAAAGFADLWMAEKSPNARIAAISNSHSQREHIESVLPRARFRKCPGDHLRRQPTYAGRGPGSIAWYRWKCSSTCATTMPCSAISRAG